MATVTIQSINDFNELVKVNLLGVPLGFSPSFNPDSVTPPANGPASSTLRVSVSPTVAAGTYSFGVRAIVGAPLFHDFTVVVDVNSTSQNLNQIIDTFVAIGAIDNAGIGAALKAKVTNAQRLMDSGQPQSAVNTLSALQIEIEVQAGKHIATSADTQWFADGLVQRPARSLCTKLTRCTHGDSSLDADLSRRQPVGGPLLPDSPRGPRYMWGTSRPTGSAGSSWTR